MADVQRPAFDVGDAVSAFMAMQKGMQGYNKSVADASDFQSKFNDKGEETTRIATVNIDKFTSLFVTIEKLNGAWVKTGEVVEKLKINSIEAQGALQREIDSTIKGLKDEIALLDKLEKEHKNISVTSKVPGWNAPDHTETDADAKRLADYHKMQVSYVEQDRRIEEAKLANLREKDAEAEALGRKAAQAVHEHNQKKLAEANAFIAQQKQIDAQHLANLRQKDQEAEALGRKAAATVHEHNKQKAAAIAEVQRREEQAYQSQLQGFRNSESELKRNAAAHAAATSRILLSWQSVLRLFEVQLLHRAISSFTNAVKQSIGESIKFGRGIAEIQSITEAASNSTQQWTTTLRKLSETYALPILDATRASYEAISNQLIKSTQDFTFLRHSAELAVIGVGSHKTAVDAMTSAMNAYNMSMSESNHVAAILFETIKMGRIRLEEMESILGRLYLIASQTGVGFDDINASLATLTIQGIKADTASTLLQNVMLRMVKPSKELQQVFTDIGASSFNNAVEMYGFQEVMKIVEQRCYSTRDAMEEVGKQYRNIRAISGVTALFRDDLTSVNVAAMKNAEAEKERALQSMMTSDSVKLQSEIEKVKNLFNVTYGTELVANLVKATESIGGLTNGLTLLVKTITGAAAAWVIYKGSIVGSTLATSAFETVDKAYTASIIANSKKAQAAKTASYTRAVFEAESYYERANGLQIMLTNGQHNMSAQGIQDYKNRIAQLKTEGDAILVTETRAKGFFNSMQQGAIKAKGALSAMGAALAPFSGLLISAGIFAAVEGLIYLAGAADRAREALNKTREEAEKINNIKFDRWVNDQRNALKEIQEVETKTFATIFKAIGSIRTENEKGAKDLVAIHKITAKELTRAYDEAWSDIESRIKHTSALSEQLSKELEKSADEKTTGGMKAQYKQFQSTTKGYTDEEKTSAYMNEVNKWQKVALAADADMRTKLDGKDDEAYLKRMQQKRKEAEEARRLRDDALSQVEKLSEAENKGGVKLSDKQLKEDEAYQKKKADFERRINEATNEHKLKQAKKLQAALERYDAEYQTKVAKRPESTVDRESYEKKKAELEDRIKHSLATKDTEAELAKLEQDYAARHPDIASARGKIESQDQGSKAKEEEAFKKIQAEAAAKKKAQEQTAQDWRDNYTVLMNYNVVREGGMDKFNAAYAKAQEAAKKLYTDELKQTQLLQEVRTRFEEQKEMWQKKTEKDEIDKTQRDLTEQKKIRSELQKQQSDAMIGHEDERRKQNELMDQTIKDLKTHSSGLADVKYGSRDTEYVDEQNRAIERYKKSVQELEILQLKYKSSRTTPEDRDKLGVEIENKLQAIKTYQSEIDEITGKERAFAHPFEGTKDKKSIDIVQGEWGLANKKTMEQEKTYKEKTDQLAAVQKTYEMLADSAKSLKDEYGLTADASETAAERIVKDQKRIQDELRITFELLNAHRLAQGQSAIAVPESVANPIKEASGGFIQGFARGGFSGTDRIPAMLSAGEYVMDATTTRNWYPMIEAMHQSQSKATGGSTTNVGDIHVSVNGGDTSQATVREIAQQLRREIRRGTLNN